MSATEEPKRLLVELITPDGPVFVDDARMVVVLRCAKADAGSGSVKSSAGT